MWQPMSPLDTSQRYKTYLLQVDKPHIFLFEGLGERHDLQGPGRLQQATPVRTQRNAEGGEGGKS